MIQVPLQESPTTVSAFFGFPRLACHRVWGSFNLVSKWLFCLLPVHKQDMGPGSTVLEEVPGSGAIPVFLSPFPPSTALYLCCLC